MDDDVKLVSKIMRAMWSKISHFCLDCQHHDLLDEVLVVPESPDIDAVVVWFEIRCLDGWVSLLEVRS